MGKIIGYNELETEILRDFMTAEYGDSIDYVFAKGISYDDYMKLKNDMFGGSKLNNFSKSLSFPTIVIENMTDPEKIVDDIKQYFTIKNDDEIEGIDEQSYYMVDIKVPFNNTYDSSRAYFINTDILKVLSKILLQSGSPKIEHKLLKSKNCNKEEAELIREQIKNNLIVDGKNLLSDYNRKLSDLYLALGDEEKAFAHYLELKKKRDELNKILSLGENSSNNDVTTFINLLNTTPQISKYVFNNNHLYIYFKTYLEKPDIIDPKSVFNLIKNRQSSWYNELSSTEKELFDDWAYSSAKIIINTGVAISFNNNRSSVDIGAITSDSSATNCYLPNPHIGWYNCFGNSKEVILNLFYKKNYEGFINQLLYVVSNLNLDDNAVAPCFAQKLKNIEQRCILYNDKLYTPKNFMMLKRTEAKEAKAIAEVELKAKAEVAAELKVEKEETSTF